MHVKIRSRSLKIPHALARESFLPAMRLLRDQVLDKSVDVAYLRSWMARLDETFPDSYPDAVLSEVALEHCKATWFDVKGARKGRVMLYLHGGAFIFETPRLHGSLVARLCRLTQCDALMPSYRLAPEHPFPAGPDDCLAAYRYLLEKGYSPQDIVVAGDSAGGGLTLSLLLRLKAEGLPPPAAAVALSPVTDGKLSGDTINRNDGNDPMFTANCFRNLAPLFVSDKSLMGHPHVSPLYGDLNGLPPILLMVGSTELLLDDSIRFAMKCPSAKLEVWHDMPHVFPLFEFLPETEEAVRRAARFMRQQIAVARGERVADATKEAVEESADTPVELEQPSIWMAKRDHAVGTVLSARWWLMLCVLSGVAAMSSIGGLWPTWLGAAGVLPGLFLPWEHGGLSAPNVLGTLAVLPYIFLESNHRTGLMQRTTAALATLILGPVCGLVTLMYLQAKMTYKG